MRTVQPPQPAQAACGVLAKRMFKGPASHPPRGRLIETGGNPLLRLPRSFLSDQQFQIPAPFKDLVRPWEDSDESKWVNMGKRQALHNDIGTIW
jgi:hypothetical protein